MYKVTIPQDIVNKIQFADYKVRGLQASCNGLLEMHLQDERNVVLATPIFQELSNELGEAKEYLETCKEEMLRSVLSDSDYNKLCDWELIYASCQLLYRIEDKDLSIIKGEDLCQ